MGLEGQGDRVFLSQASGNTSQGSWKEVICTEHPQCVRLLHAKHWMFSHFTLGLTLPGKQALQAVTINSRAPFIMPVLSALPIEWSR